MAAELTCLDHKHIFVEKMKMSVDRVLQCYIRNMSSPPSPLIENYLREAGFWHVAIIGRGRTHSIFYAKSVPSLWRTCSYNWDCQWMGLHSPSPSNLLIGELYVTIFWVRFQIIFTEVGSRWAGYETHSRSRGMIRLK
ncbi:hypothetical protein Gotur_015522 [Gossypium turneri]